MEKIKIPTMVQDIEVLEMEGLNVAEHSILVRPFYDDGPSTDKVKILDHHPLATSPFPLPGAKYEPGEKHHKKVGWYTDQDLSNINKKIRAAQKIPRNVLNLKEQIYSHTFIQVSVFGIALKTLDLFEKNNILGREFAWAFGEESLTYKTRSKHIQPPRAQYNRESKTIQFSYIVDEAENLDETAESVPGFYAALSRDVVAHETAHAIIDGINPFLFDSINPQSRALHESLADLISLLLAYKSNTLPGYILEKTRGSIADVSQFSKFADQLGPLVTGQKVEPLRSFLNKAHLNLKGDEKTYASPKKPYDISTVLSGALFDVIVTHHVREKERLIKETYSKDPEKYKDPDFSSSGSAMTNVARRIRILLPRALDYLPPGEVTLADYGRALLEVDKNLFGSSTPLAQTLQKELYNRSIFVSEYDIPVEINMKEVKIHNDVKGILSDGAMRDKFIEENREWLGIPNDVPYKIKVISNIAAPSKPKEFICVNEFQPNNQAILKIYWHHQEQSGIKVPGQPYPNREIQLGTAVVFDATNNSVISRLSCAKPTPSLFPTNEQFLTRERAFEQRRKDIDTFFMQQIEEGKISVSTIASKIHPTELAAFDSRNSDYDIQVVDDVLIIKGKGFNSHP